MVGNISKLLWIRLYIMDASKKTYKKTFLLVSKSQLFKPVETQRQTNGKSWKVRIDLGWDPTAGFFQGWLLPVLLTYGALNDLALFNAVITVAVSQCAKNEQEDIFKRFSINFMIPARNLRLLHIIGQGKTNQLVQKCLNPDLRDDDLNTMQVSLDWSTKETALWMVMACPLQLLWRLWKVLIKACIDLIVWIDLAIWNFSTTQNYTYSNNISIRHQWLSPGASCSTSEGEC